MRALTVAIMILIATMVLQSSLDNIKNSMKQDSNRLIEIEKILLSKDARSVTITAYMPNKAECGGDFEVTASMKKVKPGMVAVSRDLLELGWTFGKKVYISGFGVYRIADLVSEEHTNRIDILVFSKRDINNIGMRRNVIASIIKE